MVQQTTNGVTEKECQQWRQSDKKNPSQKQSKAMEIFFHGSCMQKCHSLNETKRHIQYPTESLTTENARRSNYSLNTTWKTTDFHCCPTQYGTTEPDIPFKKLTQICKASAIDPARLRTSKGALSPMASMVSGQESVIQKQVNPSFDSSEDKNEYKHRVK